MESTDNPTNTDPPRRYSFGDLTMDVGQRRVWRGDQPVEFSKLTFALLRLLVERAPNVVAHQECARFVWGPKRIVTPENLSQRIAKLRQALGESSAAPRYVESLRGEGYRLIPEVREVTCMGPEEQGERRPNSSWSALRYLTGGLLIVAVAIVFLILNGRLTDVPAPSILPLTFDGGLKGSPQLSPSGDLLAFDWVEPEGSVRSIYVRAIGSNARSLKLTEAEGMEMRPVWSPDGKELAFLRVADGRAGIHIIPALGGRERKVIDIDGPVNFANRVIPSLSWSPNGQYLAYAEKADPAEPFGIVILNLATLEKTTVTSPVGGSEAIGDFHPAFTPDGRRIAFVRGLSVWSNLDVWVVGVDGENARRLTRENWAYCEGLSWVNEQELLLTAGNLFGRRAFSVDLDDGVPRLLPGLGNNDRSSSSSGDRIAFTRVDAEPPDVMRVPGRLGATQGSPAADLMLDGADKTFSPAGDRIAYQSQRRGRAQIWIADQDGANQTPLTAVRTAALRPRWSLDGSTILFESYDSGSADVYAVDLASMRVKPLTSRSSNEMNATVSRDGRSFYFSSDRTGQYQIFRKPIAGGEAQQVTSQGGYYGIESQDGMSLYFVRRQFGSGIWRLPFDGGNEELVFDQPKMQTWLSWDLVAGGIYYEVADRDEYAIYYRDLQSGDTVEIYQEAGPFLRFWLAVSPDEQSVLFSRHRIPSSEIYIVENYR